MILQADTFEWLDDIEAVPAFAAGLHDPVIDCRLGTRLGETRHGVAEAYGPVDSTFPFVEAEKCETTIAHFAADGVVRPHSYLDLKNSPGVGQKLSGSDWLRSP